jgi:hypothetical protein
MTPTAIRGGEPALRKNRLARRRGRDSVSIDDLSDIEIAFARDLADRLRWARKHNDEFPAPEWSRKESLAVALVLDKRDYLDTQYPHGLLSSNPVSHALDYVCWGIVRRGSGQDRIAWLRSIRDAAEDFIREPPEPK